MRDTPLVISIICTALASAAVAPSKSIEAVYSLTKWECWESESLPECTNVKAKQDLSSTLSTVTIVKECLKYAAELGCAARITMTPTFGHTPVQPVTSLIRKSALYGATIPKDQRVLSDDVVSGDVVSGDVVSGDVARGDVVRVDVVSGDVARGDLEGWKETFNTLVLTPGGAGNKLMGFNSLHVWAGKYAATDSSVPDPLSLILNSSEVTPRVTSDTDKAVTWKTTTEEKLPPIIDDLTIGVWVTSAQAEKAKMRSFTPSVRIEYSSERVFRPPPIADIQISYQLTEWNCKHPRGASCKGKTQRFDEFLNYKEAKMCLEYAAKHNCSTFLSVETLIPKHYATVTFNETHALYGKTFPGSGRLRKEGMAGFKETVASLGLYSKRSTTDVPCDKMTGFNTLRLWAGTYDPILLFRPAPMSLASSTVKQRAENDQAWKVIWNAAKEDMSALPGDLTIGVLVTRAEAAKANMRRFLPSLDIEYSLTR